jgi:multidrug efflux pump subunit AcrA (membrane-fusion protein)
MSVARSSPVAIRLVWYTVAGLAPLAGCETPEPPPPPLPTVTVARPVVRDVVDALQFTGRTEAVESVEIRARVEGFLESIHFEDGAAVQQGDLLFVIDKKPFEADVRAVEAKLAQSTAARDLAKANLGRAEKLMPSGAITLEEYQTRAAELEVAEAAILADQAAVEQASIRLGYTDIRDAVVLAFLPPPITGLGNAGGFEFQLQDRGNAGIVQLEAIAGDFVYQGTKAPGLTRMNSNLRANVPQLYLDVDRVKVKKVGVPLETVFGTLQAFLGSAYVNDFNKDGRVYRVMIQADHQFRNKIEDI